MRILYFIGNGFDLNLGLDTRYSDFYKYYQITNSKSVHVNKLKDQISADIKTWSDLELALGEYTKNIESGDDFDEIYTDLEDNLAEYLQSQESKFDYSKSDSEKFVSDLMYPENYLTQADKGKINTYRQTKLNVSDDIDIVTFNYTKSIENILGDDQINLTHKNQIGRNAKINVVEHIHGYLDNRMVMGVNDTLQIANIDFHSNRDVLETLVKNECNKTSKHNIDLKCEHLINVANLICIFGCSIGDTDKIWWDLIANQLKRQSLLIIFEKGEKIPDRRAHMIGRRERKIREFFLSKTSLSDEDKKKVIDNIFVAINTRMFDLVKK